MDILTTLWPEQNHLDVADNIFKHIFLIENNVIIQISQKFVFGIQIHNESSLVQLLVGGHQAISHYLNQCWQISIVLITPTRPQCVDWNIFLVDGIFPLPWSQRHFGVITKVTYKGSALRWCHNGGDSVSNHQPYDCLFNRLFRYRSKKTSKLCVTGLCVGNSPGTGEFPAQMASYVKNVSIWWRHHGVAKKNSC